MEKMFCLGLLLGAMGGALVVANSYKARSLVKKSQAELMEKVDEMMDERLKQMESTDKADKKSKSGERRNNAPLLLCTTLREVLYFPSKL